MKVDRPLVELRFRAGEFSSSHAPKFAQHVVGLVPRERFDEDGKLEPATVRMVCLRCGEQAQRKCETGAYRQWVDKFATEHLHRDPLAGPPKVGSST